MSARLLPSDPPDRVARARPRRSEPPASPLNFAVLLELEAALAAGAAPPQAAAAAAGDGVLASVAREVRLGRSLADVAAGVATGDPAADLLVRALAVAEVTGAGSLQAVEQAVAAVRDEASLRRVVAVRTAQARGTAVILAAVPLAAWVLLVALDPVALRFYRTPLGLLSAVVAVTLAATSWSVMRRLVRRAGAAAAAADPLTAPRPAPDWRRGAALAVPIAVMVGALVAPPLGVAAAAVVGWVGARSRAPAGPPAGSAPETVELVSVALTAGLSIGPALAAVAPLAPAPGDAVLTAAARRVRAGWAVDAALDGSGLAVLGTTLAAAEPPPRRRRCAAWRTTCAATAGPPPRRPPSASSSLSSSPPPADPARVRGRRRATAVVDDAQPLTGRSVRPQGAAMHRNPCVASVPVVDGRHAGDEPASALRGGLSRRVERLRDDGEEGAQAVEYAMIGGLGAGLIGLLWAIVGRTGILDKVIEALLSVLIELITGWRPQ